MKAPTWVDADGTLRVGQRILAAGEPPTLRCRMPPRAGAMRVYVATLLHEPGVWCVIDLQSERVALVSEGAS